MKIIIISLLLTSEQKLLIYSFFTFFNIYWINFSKSSDSLHNHQGKCFFPRNTDLAPADVKKEGSSYDLTIATGILAATEQIKRTNILSDYLIMGELSLDGFVRPVKGVLSMALTVQGNT